MIILHHLENSVSTRIVWLLEELGAEYDIKTYARDGLMAPANYRALHPAGTSPIITDGEVTLAETNAIADYLLDAFAESPLRPAVDSPERLRYLYWFHAAMGSLAPMQTMQFVHSQMVSSAPFFVRPILAKATDAVNQLLCKPRIERLLTAVNDDVNHSPWLAGETFTVADILMVQTLENYRANHDIGTYPNIQPYLQRASERDAYQRASEKIGGFVTRLGK